MRSQVVVVEDPNAEHSGVHAGAQEENGDEARHLVERNKQRKRFRKSTDNKVTLFDLLL